MGLTDLKIVIEGGKYSALRLQTAFTGKTVIPVSALLKESTQHPPHKRFDM